MSLPADFPLPIVLDTAWIPRHPNRKTATIFAIVYFGSYTSLQCKNNLTECFYRNIQKQPPHQGDQVASWQERLQEAKPVCDRTMYVPSQVITQTEGKQLMPFLFSKDDLQQIPSEGNRTRSLSAPWAPLSHAILAFLHFLSPWA